MSALEGLAAEFVTRPNNPVALTGPGCLLEEWSVFPSLQPNPAAADTSLQSPSPGLFDLLLTSLRVLFTTLPHGIVKDASLKLLCAAYEAMGLETINWDRFLAE